MTRRTINLAFYVREADDMIADFSEVAHRIEAKTDDIAAEVLVSRRRLRSAPATLALVTRPTVTIEMDRARLVPPLRGRRFRHRMPGKMVEAEALASVGISVPRHVPITPDTVLDPDEWGPYVVVKPDFGRRGAYVRIQRTSRVRYTPRSTLPRKHPGRNGMIAQEFIYTGRWPTSYRVLTFLGRVVLALRFSGRRDLPPLQESTKFKTAGGHSIVATAMGNTVEQICDMDVLELARRAHTAFPDVPSLGVDIVRDARNGNLFVLETNPYGRSWLLSMEAGRSIERQFSLDLYAQFNALDIIAEASIDAARRFAC